MHRWVRWAAAAGITLAAFVVLLWLFRYATFSWLPHAEADRWVVAAGFATVGAGAVGAGAGWWAGREDPQSGEPYAQVHQHARASGHARITQIGGDQHIGERFPDVD